MTDSNKPELQSDEQAPVDKTSVDASPDSAALMRRRSLLKTGIVAVPAVMTLRSAMAADGSNCTSCMASMDQGITRTETPTTNTSIPDFPSSKKKVTGNNGKRKKQSAREPTFKQR